MLKNLKMRNRLLLFILIPLVIVFTFIVWFVSFKMINEAKENAYKEAQNIASKYANEVESKLQTALESARTLSQVFKGIKLKNSTDRTVMDSILKQTLIDNLEFLGTYTLWEPNALDGNDVNYRNMPATDATGRYIPYWNRGSGKIIVEPLLDYEKEGAGDYYLIPKKSKRESVINPYLYPIAGKEVLLTSFVIPIVIENKFYGITGVDIALSFFQEMILKIKPYETGYAFLQSNDGTFVGNPDENLIGKNISAVDNDFNTKYSIIEKIQKGENFLILKKGVSGASDSIVAYAPVHIGETNTPWTFGVSIEMDKVLEKSRQVFKTLIIIGIISLLILVGIIILISMKLSKPITELVGIASRIAEGDLSIKENTETGKDEIGLLTESFNKMIHSLKSKLEIVQKIAEGSGDFTIKVELASEKDSFGLALAKMLSSLNNILGEVDSSAEQVSGATRQVSQASQSLSSGASEQASSLEEITSSVTEINSQAKLNAENAIEAKILAETAKQKAEIGNQQMFALVSGMEKINLSSEEIKKIVKVIDNIAFQTNLLALNANVEAARAGKYGKGFAVVAEEVRNLALRSGEAVKETTQMVEESIININKGSKQVEATAEYLQEIMEVVNKVTNIVIEITSSSKEQSQALQQIQEGLSQIEQVTQQNSAYAEETASISEELSSQAFSLKDMISKFKLLKIRQEENQKTMLESISPEMLGQIKKKIASEIKQNGEKHSNH
ncbi:MAG: hypothetical protein A2Y41_10375 [Spirochaetes bacterium GWB1_36_13]|nr:MAG: hypothetical protein A2Y41_10375 [Spirochaetes bacterium GWB1_36_13]